MSECCAIIVSYNRAHLAARCLATVLDQSQPPTHVILIDNGSSDNLLDVLQKGGVIKERTGSAWSWKHNHTWLPQFTCHKFNIQDGRFLFFLRISRNIGGAGGFAAGMSFASKQLGCKWLWLLDDDALPDRTALENLLDFGNRHGGAAISPLKLSQDEKILYNHFGKLQFSWPFPTPLRKISLRERRPTRIDASSFVGLLVNQEAVEKVGLPRPDFFLHHDDIEYCMRLKKVGEIWLVPSSKVVHLEETRKKNRLLRPSILCLDYEKAWLAYYGKRNMMWLAWRNKKGMIGFGLSLAVTTAIYLGLIFLFTDNRLRRARMLFHAYTDGLNGKFFNDRPFEILYGRK